MTWTHHLLLASFLFVVGAAIGSFLNVCLYRIPARMSVLHPPSRCPRCGFRIAAFDNIPVLGWMILRGCCRHCAQPISARYPLVEFLCGLLPAAAYLLDQVGRPTDPLESGFGGFVLFLLIELVVSIFVIAFCFAGIDARRSRPQPFVLEAENPEIGSH